jgi:dephospho-CoA kinase
MSAWPGKYVIGLTGNIATGKSVVRKMLEHLGAYGIDADALGHRAIAKGAPGYKPVIKTFGEWILAPDGQINRSRLGKIVFNDPEALAALESIVHPLVQQAVDILIRRAQQKVIVVEAIKLIEAGMHNQYDSLWVTYASPQMQLARLMQKRGLDEATARLRIAAQSPQEEKMKLARVVIKNEGSFENTWRQVSGAWHGAFPRLDTSPRPRGHATLEKIEVHRGRPKDAGEIANIITRLSRGRRKMNRSEVMAAFGEKAFLVLQMNGHIIGLAGWKVENLISRTDDVFLDETKVLPAIGLKALMEEVEQNSV